MKPGEIEQLGQGQPEHKQEPKFSISNPVTFHSIT